MGEVAVGRAPVMVPEDTVAVEASSVLTGPVSTVCDDAKEWGGEASSPPGDLAPVKDLGSVALRPSGRDEP